ncbi:MAG: peptidase M61, partial [Eudoraea sp.]|nr:peptidase M61 [Eudoraea sp.]
MKKTVYLLLFGLVVTSCSSLKNTTTQGKSPIRASIDLVNVLEDKVKVTIDPGVFVDEEVYFSIPKIIPGTYSEDNYGKYLEDFNALDYEGKPLEVTRKDENSWIISSGSKLDKIVYYVNDTYDTETEISDPIFSPAGTNILKDENYLLNLHGFIGYFSELKEVPYELKIEAPIDLKPSTSLRQIVSGAADPNTSVFFADRYFEVIDNPILFAKPNSTSFQINDIKVTLSVYSPNDVYKAVDLSEKMETMMRAQKTFLGEIDGTKQYTVILYLSTLEPTDAIGFGALEHHTSTVVVLPEQLPKESMEESMVDVVSHEFFHIVTPLNVHSREIQYFDFNQPKMSQHLWMYEGATEYFANLFQVQQGLIDESAFYDRMLNKISNSKGYDDEMSFTTMSKNVLISPYKKNYNNVYEKGALINMA